MSGFFESTRVWSVSPYPVSEPTNGPALLLTARQAWIERVWLGRVENSQQEVGCSRFGKGAIPILLPGAKTRGITPCAVGRPGERESVSPSTWRIAPAMGFPPITICPLREPELSSLPGSSVCPESEIARRQNAPRTWWIGPPYSTSKGKLRSPMHTGRKRRYRTLAPNGDPLPWTRLALLADAVFRMLRGYRPESSCRTLTICSGSISDVRCSPVRNRSVGDHAAPQSDCHTSIGAGMPTEMPDCGIQLHGWRVTGPIPWLDGSHGSQIPPS